jgi:hypothetical protein
MVESFIAEFGLTAWLLIKGVKDQKAALWSLSNRQSLMRICDPACRPRWHGWTRLALRMCSPLVTNTLPIQSALVTSVPRLLWS